MDTLTGTWLPIRAELDGELAPQEALEIIRLILSPDHYQVTFGGESSDEGDFHSREENEDLVFKLTGKKGVNAGRVIRAIARLRGDRLRICYGLDGQHPADFSTAPNSGRYLVNYRREQL